MVTIRDRNTCQIFVYFSEAHVPIPFWTLLACNLIAAASSRASDLKTHSVGSNVVHVDLAALDVVEDVGSSSDAELSHSIGFVVEVIAAAAFLPLAKEFSYICKYM